MDTQEFQEQLQEWILEGIQANTCNPDKEEGDPEIKIRSFSDVGLLTTNQGLVIRMCDGSEYQITIVQSKKAKT